MSATLYELLPAMKVLQGIGEQINNKKKIIIIKLKKLNLKKK